MAYRRVETSRIWEVPADRDYRQMRNTRPPFITQYERDLMRWQRRNRNMLILLLTACGVCATSILTALIRWTL